MPACMSGAEESSVLVGVMVIDVRNLTAVLETGCDGVLGDVVVGVFDRHGDWGGRRGASGAGRDGKLRRELARGADIQDPFQERVISCDHVHFLSYAPEFGLARPSALSRASPLRFRRYAPATNGLDAPRWPSVTLQFHPNSVHSPLHMPLRLLASMTIEPAYKALCVVAASGAEIDAVGRGGSAVPRCSCHNERLGHVSAHPIKCFENVPSPLRIHLRRLCMLRNLHRIERITFPC